MEVRQPRLVQDHPRDPLAQRRVVHRQQALRRASLVQVLPAGDERPIGDRIALPQRGLQVAHVLSEVRLSPRHR
jgi:hypothetical protein